MMMMTTLFLPSWSPQSQSCPLVTSALGKIPFASIVFAPSRGGTRDLKKWKTLPTTVKETRHVQSKLILMSFVTRLFPMDVLLCKKHHRKNLNECKTSWPMSHWQFCTYLLGWAWASSTWMLKCAVLICLFVTGYHMYVLHNMRICPNLRLRCALSESWRLSKQSQNPEIEQAISRLRNVCESQDCMICMHISTIFVCTPDSEWSTCRMEDIFEKRRLTP